MSFITRQNYYCPHLTLSFIEKVLCNPNSGICMQSNTRNLLFKPHVQFEPSSPVTCYSGKCTFSELLVFAWGRCTLSGACKIDCSGYSRENFMNNPQTPVSKMHQRASAHDGRKFRSVQFDQLLSKCHLQIATFSVRIINADIRINLSISCANMQEISSRLACSISEILCCVSVYK